MAEAYLSELRIFSFGFAPKGWAMCNGQALAINQNQALFALLGTNYGGNGQTTFNLPNLMGRTPMHVSNTFTQGQSGGSPTQTLALTQIPQHTHQAVASSNSPNAGTPANNFWPSNNKEYSGTANTAMSGGALSPTGGNQPHENMSPYLTLNICIALVGIFPSRN